MDCCCYKILQLTFFDMLLLIFTADAQMRYYRKDAKRHIISVIKERGGGGVVNSILVIISPGVSPGNGSGQKSFSPKVSAIFLFAMHLLITPTLGLLRRGEVCIFTSGLHPGLMIALRWSWKRGSSFRQATFRASNISLLCS